MRASASDPSSWVKVTGILILQILAATAFWLDARRQRRAQARALVRRRLRLGPRDRDPLRRSCTRGAASLLAQALSPSLEGASGAVQLRDPVRGGPDRRQPGGGHGAGAARRADPAIGAGVLMGLSFPVRALRGRRARWPGSTASASCASRSVLLAMGGIVAAGNLVAIVAIHFLNAGPWGWDFLYDALAGVAGRPGASSMVVAAVPADLRAPLLGRDGHPPAGALEPEPAAAAHARARGARAPTSTR